MKNTLQKTIHNLLMVIALLVLGKAAFAQAPTISSFSPDSGSIGTLVTVTGTNLNNIDTIRIGGVSAIKISSTSTSLVAMVMPGAVTGKIYLRNSSGNITSGSSFTKIASIPPNTQQGNKLVGTGGSSTDRQGYAVSVSTDGNTAIVGGKVNFGSAWIYTRSGGVWSQQGNKLVGTGYIGLNYQGSSVSISADGNTVIVGGNNDSNGKGAAWIFTRSGGVWNQQGGKLVGSGSIGAAYQGYAVSLSADGNTALIGGYLDNNQQGAVWVFTRSGGIWSQQGSKLVGTGNVGAARQGSSVSLSADGNTIIVGGYNDNNSIGATWIYTRSGGIWSQQGNKLVGTGSIGTTFQGSAVSLSADGNTAIVGGYFDNTLQGAAWIFTRNLGVWNQQGSKLVGTGSVGDAEQGYSVCLSADGNIAMVGGHADNNERGAAWFYIRNGSVWSQLGSKLVGLGNIGTKTLFGGSLCLSGDGKTAIVGGNWDNNQKGSTWVYIGAFSTNANLSALSLSSGTLNPVFGANTIAYTSSTTASNLSVTPIKSDSNSTIQIRINGGLYVTTNNGIPSNSLSLNVGTNIIDIKITAQDGITIKIYSITVTRISIAPTITSFSPDSGSIGTLVTIIGTNLNILDTIKIGGVSAIKVSATSTSLKAMVMPGAVTGNIYLSNSSGNVTSTSNFLKINNIPPTAQQGNKLVGTGSVGIASQGSSVAISADGNTAIVGAPGDSSNQGAAWIFVRIGGVWTQQGNKLVGTGNVGVANQGSSVSISADGNTAIIGGPRDSSNQGAVWVFVRNGGIWTQQGNKLVGTGNLGFANQGRSVSISADGNTAIIGGPTDNGFQGAAWIFTRNGGVWSQQGNKFAGSGSSGFGLVNQGSSVSLSGDGNTAIIGGPHDNGDTGAVWIFVRSGSIWSQQGSKLVGTGAIQAAQQGNAVTISADGNTILVSGIFDNRNIGATWVYIRSGGVWSQQGNKLVGTGSSGPRQGCSLSISADGNTALIGDDRGAAWVFTRSGTIWSQQGNKRVGTGGTGNYIYQVGSVDLSADGNTVILGGPGDNYNQGAVWMINGPASSNANLSNIILSSGILSPVFASDTIAYTSTTTTSSTVVTSIKVETNATILIRINGGVYTTVNSGSASSSLALNLGNNTIDIKVTAQDGTTIKIYTITINRLPSTNAKLSIINLIGTSYLPTFQTDTLTYAANVLFSLKNVRVSSILSDTLAKMEIKMNSGVFTNINNKDTSAILPLNVGLNTLAIKVTAQDTAVTRTYLINITRAAAIPPSAMSYASPSIIATRTITNINNSITYSGDSITSFSISPTLPNGVSFDTLTGRISGVPTVVFPQTVFTITGTNSSGSTTANFTLTVNRIAPSNLKYNDSIVIATRTITNINSSVTYAGDSIANYSITPSLPIGLSLNSTTGLISGIPLVTLPQTTFTVTGTNNGGSSTASFRLTVNKIAPSNFIYNDSIVIATRTITNINSSVTYAGDSIANFSITPSLPSGLSLNTLTGLISGIPTVALPQTTFTITGTNNGGSATASFKLTVNRIAPSNLKYNDSIVIATRTITNINSSVTYAGDSIANYSITPSLPIGLSLNSTTGLISGIPLVTLPQTTFTVTGTNNGGSTTANFTLTVNRIAPSNLKYNDSIVIATRTITNINSLVTYSGDSIANFSITPALPSGVTLNTSTGLISGIPTVNVAQTVFTITGSNSGGSSTASFRLTVNKIAPSNLKYTDSLVVATRTITNINSSVTYAGDSIANYSITPSLPIGLSLNSTTGLISGIPTVIMPQTTFTITGTNNGGSTTASFTLTVNKIAPRNLKYNDSIVIATRTITNLNSSVTYSGDSVDSFSITPSLPNGVTLNTSTGLISGIPTVNIPRTVFTITGSNNGGSTTASFTLTVNSPVSIKSINIETFSNINIKPNPFNSQIEIDFRSNTKEITQFIILDAVGKEVFSKNLESNIGNNTFRIDELTYLKGGIYFARLANNNGYSKIFKLIKE